MQLLKSCMEGEHKAQKQLYMDFAPLVKAVISKYLDNKEDAKDLLNEIFMRIFDKLPLYKPTGSFEGWIRRLAINIIIDHIRKNMKLERTYASDFVSYDIYVPDDIPGKIAYKELIAMIQTLPQTQRTVFNLFVFENLTHKEIASLLGMNESNSRWHLNSARTKLKEELNKHMP